LFLGSNFSASSAKNATVGAFRRV